MVILSNSWTKWSVSFHFQFILGASGAFKRATTSAGNGYLFLLSIFFINQVGQNRRIKLIHQPMKSIQVPPMCIALKCIFNLKLFYILVSIFCQLSQSSFLYLLWSLSASSHIVWKLLKMSHLNFLILLHIPLIFVFLKWPAW